MSNEPRPYPDPAAQRGIERAFGLGGDNEQARNLVLKAAGVPEELWGIAQLPTQPAFR